MPSALTTALAAPIHEVASQVGPGWTDEEDPTVALVEVRELLADVSAATHNSWSRTADGWSGAGADGAADFVSTAAQAADRLSQQVEMLRARTADASDAVECARSRLREIINRFEDRAAALEPRLDEPGVAEELQAEAQRALGEAVDVVDELRAELDGHAAAVTAASQPPESASAAPAMPAGFTAPAGFGGTPLGSPSGLGGMPAAYGAPAPEEAGLAALPLPDPDQLGDGVAVTLPDGSTVTAPNAVAADAVRHALTQLGVPYVWGGTTPGVGLGLQWPDAVGVSRSGTGSSAACPGAGPRRRRQPRLVAAG